MPEDTHEFFERVTRRVREKARQLASRRIARNAALLFAQNKEQEPVHTFSATSQSEFDLRKLNPGTIFRHSVFSEQGCAYYWYVVGSERNKTEPSDIFRIESAFGPDSERLRLHNNWKLKDVVPRKVVFSIKEASRALNFPDQKLKTIGIDLMCEGTEIEKGAPGGGLKQRSHKRLTSLKFAPQKVSILSH